MVDVIGDMKYEEKQHPNGNEINAAVYEYNQYTVALRF